MVDIERKDNGVVGGWIASSQAPRNDKMSVLRLCVLVGFILFGVNLCAEVYLLHDLINHGLNNSTNIIRSQSSVLDARDNLRRAYLDILPSANISMSYSNPSGSDSHYSSNFSISKSSPLNNPRYFNVMNSRNNRRIEELNYENAQKQIARDVLFAFIDVVQQQRSVRIMEEDFQLQRRVHEQIQIHFNQGRRTVFELQESQIDTLNAHISLIDERNRLVRLRENLFFMIKLEDKGFPLEYFEFALQTPEADLAQREHLNLSIQGSEMRLENSRRNLTQQHFSLFPSLSVSYSRSSGYFNRELNNEFVNFDNYTTSSTFSVNLSYPLFNHFTQNINYRMAKRHFSLEQLMLQDMIETTSQQIANLEKDLISLRHTYELSQQRFELSSVSLRMAEERFALGIISSLDLDRTRQQHIRAESELVDRFYRLIKQQEELNFLRSDKILGIW